MTMKIYTKKGDSGTTQLIGGTRVPKHHLRIEAYGTVDELNSFIGLIRDQQIHPRDKAILLEIQDRLFTIGSSLASDPEKSRMKIPDLKEEDVMLLEKEIDAMNDKLPEMKSFILPGGHTTVSYCHIARCVCRRAERLSTQLSETAEGAVEPIVLKYLNRLSDYLFMLSRMLSHDLKAEEMPWKPRM
jgi:cob(I)alamin adenosyltransferase